MHTVVVCIARGRARKSRIQWSKMESLHADMSRFDLISSTQKPDDLGLFI